MRGEMRTRGLRALFGTCQFGKVVHKIIDHLKLLPGALSPSISLWALIVEDG